MFKIRSRRINSFKGLESLESIYEFDINDNFRFDNFEGLENLKKIHTTFNCNNSNIENFQGLNRLDSINEGRIRNNRNLTSLIGLEKLSYVKRELEFRNNDDLVDVSSLSGLKEVGNLIISRNDELRAIENINNLEQAGIISIELNDELIRIDGFEALTQVDEKFAIANNRKLLDLNFPDSLFSVSYLNIIGNDLLPTIDIKNLNDVEFLSLACKETSEFIGFEKIDSLVEFRINEFDTVEDLTFFRNLKHIEGTFTIAACDGLKSLKGLESLNHVGGNITISFNENLSNIFPLNNVKFQGEEIKVYANPKLNNCNIDPICDILKREIDGSLVIGENDSNCIDSFTVSKFCDGLSWVKAQYFFDENQNKIFDPEERYLRSSYTLIEPDNKLVEFNPNSEGLISIGSGERTFSYHQEMSPLWRLTTDSISYSFNLEDQAIETIEFGLYPEYPESNLHSTFNISRLRCNENSNVVFSVTNLGTTIGEGIMWFDLPNNFDKSSIDIVPDTILNDGTVGWFFDDLYPGEVSEIRFHLMIPGPDDIEIGSILEFCVYIEYEKLDGSLEYSDCTSLFQSFFCSIDPNDKLVRPQREENYTLFDEDLLYTIRFQNTGNDTAYNLYILDTLSQKLDISTFRVVSSSHTEFLTTSVSNSRILRFDFDNIYLPDSIVNFDASQGYVSYLIKARGDLQEFDPVLNAASIYFDANPPVHTNTVENVMLSSFDLDMDGVEIFNDCNDLDSSIFPGADEIPNNGIDEDCNGEDLLSSLYGINYDWRSRVLVYPNPAKTFLNIDYPHNLFLRIELFDVLGKLRLSSSSPKRIDISSLIPGVYILCVNNGNEKHYIKIQVN